MNPLKFARTQQGMTQRQLAELAGVSVNAVLRYEQGLYENPSANIIHHLAENPQHEQTLKQKYYDWRIVKQREAAFYFHPRPQLAVRPNEHPFTTFRKTITQRAVGKESAISFCILLAINAAALQEYEKGKHAHIPSHIWAALVTAQLPDSYIENLDQLGVIYYERSHRAS